MKPCLRCNRGQMLPVASAEEWRCIQCGYYRWSESAPTPPWLGGELDVSVNRRVLKMPAEVSV